MSEINDRLNRILRMCEGNSGICKDIAFEARMALQAVESSPLTVIAPPLEWGERVGFLIQSKCGKYDLRLMAGTFSWMAWCNDFTPITRLPVEQSEAIAACQAHRLATVNAALEGCKIIPYRDPQGLVDRLRGTNRAIIDVDKHGDSMDKLRVAHRLNSEEITKWEEGK